MKIVLRDSTITDDITLLYPNQSGTIGRVQDITGNTFSSARISYSEQSVTNIVLNNGFWTALTDFTSGTLIGYSVIRAIYQFRCNRISQNGTPVNGLWQFRVQNGNLDLGYPVFTVPDSGTGLYNWGTWIIDYHNPLSTSSNFILGASKTSGGGQNASAQARLIKLTYF